MDKEISEFYESYPKKNFSYLTAFNGINEKFLTKSFTKAATTSTTTLERILA